MLVDLTKFGLTEGMSLVIINNENGIRMIQPETSVSGAIRKEFLLI